MGLSFVGNMCPHAVNTASNEDLVFGHACSKHFSIHWIRGCEGTIVSGTGYTV